MRIGRAGGWAARMAVVVTAAVFFAACSPVAWERTDGRADPRPTPRGESRATGD